MDGHPFLLSSRNMASSGTFAIRLQMVATEQSYMVLASLKIKD